jgi:hypothetical protein
MKVGDLVENWNSESRMTGVIVSFELLKNQRNGYSIRVPVVLWSDGRCNWVARENILEVDNESR